MINISSTEISKKVLEDFNADPQLLMYNFPIIYKKLLNIIPDEKISFRELSIESAIACETITSAICNNINWDFLRKQVLIKTLQEPNWIKPINLKNITSDEVFDILKNYNKPDRIQANERSKMLRELGDYFFKNQIDFFNIFLLKNNEINNYNEIYSFFKKNNIFGSDPAEKKFNLLIQKVSNYSQLKLLSNYSKSTIDYHLVRLFLRRGLIDPKTEYARNFIFKVSKGRKEHTMGALRQLCANLINIISEITLINSVTINQIEWWVGRSICHKENPDCLLEKKDSEWAKQSFNKCPYYDTCYAVNQDNNFLKLSEPTYKGSSY